MVSIFKPWTWFNSEERKLKEDLLRVELETAKQRLEMQIFYNETEKSYKRASEVVDKGQDILADFPVKPYSTLRLVNDTVIVTTPEGDMFTKSGIDKAFYESVKATTTEVELYNLFFEKPVNTPTNGVSERVEVETPEERRSVLQNSKVLSVNPDFKVSEGKIYLTGVDLEMPASVAGSFIEILEKILLAATPEEKAQLTESYEALKMFWYWTALNPIEASRNDLLSFVRREDIKITKNGLLEMYRRVVSKGKSNKDLVNFISNNYYKVKRWKKSPDNYRIVELKKGVWQLEKVNNTSPGGTILGNLTSLYNDLPNMSENTYTDAHTRSKDIRIGAVYKEDEDKIDLSNNVACGGGLHTGSHTFMFSGFGDTGVLVLVNPLILAA